MNYDFVIIGAGFAGCVLAERIANLLNKTVLIIEKRNHIGGNCFDYFDENGILVHKYGPHIFHTNNKKVWDYLSQFTNWHFYFHKVLAVVEGKKVPLPFNLNSIDLLFPEHLATKFAEKLVNKYGYGLKIPILKLKEDSDDDLKFIAEYIYSKVFLGYTTKQWDLSPNELDYSVTSRVPILIGRDDRYFQDTFQGIPKQGYTQLFQNLLNNKNISVLLNTDYKSILDDLKYRKLIYTGEIDYFFDFEYGYLPYRSLEFEFRSIKQPNYQETAQVNYPNNYDFTRITEFKHFLPYNNEFTTIALEYPTKYERNKNQPYYPIPKKENDELYQKYWQLAQQLKGKVYFVGRLAEYKYYNMDQVVASALMLFNQIASVE
ncbi:MAG: UDP-galactopyranose mutase [Bacteroidota bacterium]